MNRSSARLFALGLGTAAALALALAAGGRRTLVVEVEGRQGLARLFAHDAREQRVQLGRGGRVAFDPAVRLLKYEAGR